MKVLLIQPPSRQQAQEEVVVPPLGLAYLASVVEQDGHKVRIIDAFAEGLTWNRSEEHTSELQSHHDI
jgi:hypothetical protein